MDGAWLFSVVPSDRARGNRHKLERRGFHMNMRKKILYCEADRASAQASQPGCRFSIPGDIQNLPGCLPVSPAVGNLLWQGAGLGYPQRSPPTHVFCDSLIIPINRKRGKKVGVV